MFGSAVWSTVKLENGVETELELMAVNVLAPVDADGAMVIVIGSEVSVRFAETFPFTPVPLNSTSVTPRRFVPAIVADTVVPCAPDTGETPEIEGTAVGSFVSLRIRLISMT